ncbi:MAG: ABC transporter ATP-binding protein [Candidatus Bathyarchaeota archaeon]|nr:MAG: ABC transporter ATP-binding protein [Candidatus Bathyarchaeota archaeon]
MTILVKDLVKIYTLGALEVQALRGLNLTIEKGEMVSLIGPSGSGKTTLLNIIGGLDRASAGSVRVFDVELTKLNAQQLVKYRRDTVGHVFQTMNLIPTLTAAENIELPMVALGMPKESRRERVKELVDVVGLTPRREHKPGELSGGEQQRVALAAALANDPPVVLADEPTGELDTANARIVVDYLTRVNREMGKTILMVTHDPAVSRAADRILRIQDGQIVADVAPAGEEVGGHVSYADLLKSRISEIDSQLIGLDARFRNGEMTGDDFAQQQTRLKGTRDVLVEELHRLGVVH